ncbi:MAG: hypothetical protein BroJett039_11350 [Chloroflexota bacterium]|nr:MAG: hypothetical protein BroJett039_11350 [Chloroflexota bacterium]
MQNRLFERSLIVIGLVTLLVLIKAPAIASKGLANQGNIELSSILSDKPTAPELAWRFFSSVYLNVTPLDEQQRKQLVDTANHFGQSLALDPTNLRALVGLARANAFSGGVSQADRYYKQLVVLHNLDPFVVEESAQVAYKLGDEARAISFWNLNRLALGPYFAGLYYKEKQDWTRSEQQLSITVRVQPENATAQFYLCVAQNNLGHSLQIALLHCQEAARLDPKSMYKHAYLASLLAEAGDLDGAFGEARTAIQLRADPPVKSAAYMIFGNILIKKGQYREAIMALKQSISLSPDARAYYWLGMAYKYNRQMSDARTAWEQSLALEPDFGPALLEIENLQSGE